MKQPSPNWLEFTLREVQVYMKKTAKQQNSILSAPIEKVPSNPFDAFKSQIKTNLKNLKKEQESNNSPFPGLNGENANGISPREIAAMAKFHWTDEVPSFMYNEDVRRTDLHYNILH